MTKRVGTTLENDYHYQEDDFSSSGGNAQTSERGQERTPGVYVKSEEYPNELDVLWSGAKQFNREERSPFVFLSVGLAVGIALTSAVFLLVMKSPEVKVGDSELTEAVVTEKTLTETTTPPAEPSQTQVPPTEQVSETAATTESTEAAPKAAEKPLLQFPTLPIPTKATEAPKPAKTNTKAALAGAKTYTVTSGDTLEVIARRYYGSGTPNYVEKIRIANNINNVDAIFIGQKLVIPPKSY